jgi:flagellar basal-body rod protein FlgF
MTILRGHLYADDGLTSSIKGMHTNMMLMNTHTDNIANFGVPGYQQKQAVVTSFAEFIGPNAVDQVVNTDIGRLRLSEQPLDVALNTKGYFQRLTNDGTIEMTRDGRFKIDAEGWLRSLEDKKILGADGAPIRFTIIPKELNKEVKITRQGDVQFFNHHTGKSTVMGRLAIANAKGGPVDDVEVRQGYVEDSNVLLQDEFVAFMPLRREFEANRNMFIVQNDLLSRLIQELGRTQ